jgi:hypothetical protein
VRALTSVAGGVHRQANRRYDLVPRIGTTASRKRAISGGGNWSGPCADITDLVPRIGTTASKKRTIRGGGDWECRPSRVARRAKSWVDERSRAGYPQAGVHGLGAADVYRPLTGSTMSE